MQSDHPLIYTKLSLPFIRKELVPRPRLQNQVAQGLLGPLTLIAAPAGFGKTTLAASSVSSSGLPVAWLSLDKGDNHIQRFLSYFIAAIQKADHTIGGQVEQILAASHQVAPETIMISLINEIDSTRNEMILVLDDYQTISNREVHDAVAFLLEYCPLNLHLLIATRSDPPLPFARLRARDQMIELRSADLRFNETEAAQFLNDMMGLRLDATSIAVLEERTEGWIAGLQMAALSMHDRQDISGFIKGFSGTSRYILDYLLEEVLACQPAEIQRFLLSTSILERLTAPLCEAIVGTLERSNVPTVKRSNEILEYLERSNLFLVPLDDERRWYRYHQLFAELLQNRLRQENTWEAIADLHYKASCWFENHQSLDEAIDHALEGKHYQRVAILLEENFESFLSHLNSFSPSSGLQSLPPDVFLDHPWVTITYGWILVATGRITVLERLLPILQTKIQSCQLDSQAESPSGRDLEDQDLCANIFALQAYDGFFRGNMEIAIERGCMADRLASQSNHTLKTRISTMLGESYLANGQLESAEQYLREAIRLNREVLDLNTTIVAYIRLGALYKIRGKLNAASEIYHEAFQLLDSLKCRENPMAGTVEVGMADILRERDKLEESRQMLSQALEKRPQLGKPYEVVFAHIGMTRVLCALEDLDGAAQSIASIQALIQTHVPPPITGAMVNNCKVFLYRKLGDLQKLNQLIMELIPLFNNQRTTVTASTTENNGITLARGLLA